MKKIIWTILAGLFLAIGYCTVCEYPKFQKKARESEIKLQLEAFKTAEG